MTTNSKTKTKIKSAVFGDLEFNSERIIYFNDGIPGLENVKEYIFFIIEEYKSISWMVSLDGKYHFPLVLVNKIAESDWDEESMSYYLPKLKTLIDQEPDMVPYVIIKLNPVVKTVSLKAPILVNVKNQTGRQVIFENN